MFQSNRIELLINQQILDIPDLETVKVGRYSIRRNNINGHYQCWLYPTFWLQMSATFTFFTHKHMYTDRHTCIQTHACWEVQRGVVEFFSMRTRWHHPIPCSRCYNTSGNTAGRSEVESHALQIWASVQCESWVFSTILHNFNFVKI